MFENIIKIIITIPLLSAVIFSTSPIIRLWNTQIDAPKTFNMWLGSQLSLSNWIATRDENSIYQNGRLIGIVEITPVIDGNKITFPRIQYVSFMDGSQVIDYRRLKCGKIKIQQTTQVRGKESASWYQNLECEIMK